MGSDWDEMEPNEWAKGGRDGLGRDWAERDRMGWDGVRCGVVIWGGMG